ncbi:MAG TPA: DHA2 family efflux MFS transporter permease subunit [Solirubrobacteraceae bacterium]|nr:DHA2 family efflux MFS transporter permease subunit [Solirubrobacteraceae bacterium]
MSASVRGPSPRAVLAIASLGAAVAFVDVTIVNIAFPDIEKSFHGTSISSLSWVLSAYNIVFAAFLVAAGRLADLLGRRRMFVLGLEIFTAASLLCALAPSTELLIAFRIVQALGAAFLVPSSLALVLNAFPPDRRSHGVALLSAVAAGAAGLGPSLGGALVAVANWRLVFLVNLPIGAAAIVLARRRLVESRTPGRRRMPDVAGSALFALATASLVLAVVKGREWGWASVPVIACFVVAVGLGVVVVRRSRWHRSPVVDLSLLRIRTFSVTNAMTVVAAAGFYGYTLTNVLFLTGVWRYTVLQAGLALTPGPFVAAAVAGPTSRLVQRIGHRPVLVAGGLIWGGAVLWFVEQVGVVPDFLGEWLPGIVMLGIGAGTLLPNLSGAAVASAPGESYATATGLNSVARQVGAALGVALVVAILGTPSPLEAASAFQHAWTFGAVCLFVAGAGCLLVQRLRPESAPSLTDAARVVLSTPAFAAAAARDRPRARRAVRVATSPPLTRPQSTAEFLGHVPLFGGLEPGLRASLAAHAAVTRLPAGEWLFREGDPGDAMYVVRAGRLEVVDEQTGTVLRELGRGDVLGELALLTESPRSASVRAARASDLLVVRRSDFDALLETSPALSRALNRVLAEQLRSTRAPAPTARPRPATIAVVGLDHRVPSLEVAEGLAVALGAHASCALLTGSEVAAPAMDDAAAAYGPLLDAAESANDLVVIAAGSVLKAGAWMEYSLQQADRILALTGGGAIPGPVSARRELRGCDLVAYDASPGALAGWAAVLEPVESHVLAPATLEDDLERTARRLAGRSIGIVLSGGGARGFAHIGVLEELLDSGLTIDRVIGVSMGAYLGALFALGLDGDEMTARCFEEWVQRQPLGDYTVPRHALIRGERFRAMLQRTFGETLIEELPRSFSSACAELRSGELRLSRHGPLWEAVGLSMCLPIIAPPQVRGRELLIDGSLVDNLPVGSMADLGEGPIIAVDVKATFERAVGSSPSSNGRTREARPPSLGETLTRVLLLGSANTSDAARRHADLVIKPRADGVGLLEFHQLDAAREAGRTAAREALAGWDVSLRS